MALPVEHLLLWFSLGRLELLVGKQSCLELTIAPSRILTVQAMPAVLAACQGLSFDNEA